MYESYCTVCNPMEVKRGKTDEITFLKEGKGVYVGESSRSLYERTREHVADRVAHKEDSHQIKHWILDHGDLQEPPVFKFRMVRSFQDPMSRQLAEAVRIELRGDGILNSKSEFNRSRVPRLRVDMEGWMKAKEKEKQETTQVEELENQEYETSVVERAMKRKGNGEEMEMKERNRPKRIKLDILEGWGENDTESPEHETIPEGWRHLETEKENEIQGMDLRTSPRNKKNNIKKTKFEFKKRGRLNKAEEGELKRTCGSMLNWVTVPTINPPLQPLTTIRDAQEDVQELEWEERCREERKEERLDLVMKKKEGWKIVRIAKDLTIEMMEKAVSITDKKNIINLMNDIVQDVWKRLELRNFLIARQLAMEMIENAISWAEERSTREIIDEIVQEGWRRIEVNRVLKIISDSEWEIQRRVMDICIHKQREEESLMEALKLEESRQERLERSRLLKVMLGKKLGAKRLRTMMRMMKQVCLGDPCMEVDEVEAGVLEIMMETDDVVGVLEEMMEENPHSNPEGELEWMDEESVAKKNERPFVNEQIFEAILRSSYCGNTTLMPFCSNIMYPDDMPDRNKKGNGGKTIIFQSPSLKQTVSLGTEDGGNRVRKRKLVENKGNDPKRLKLSDAEDV